MRIHHFSTYSGGGAAIAAHRIAAGFEGLDNAGVESRFFYRYDPDKGSEPGSANGSAANTGEAAGQFEAGVELEPDGNSLWFKKVTAKRRPARIPAGGRDVSTLPG